MMGFDRRYRGRPNAQLSFNRNASGAVTGLVLHQYGRDRPARKTR